MMLPMTSGLATRRARLGKTVKDLRRRRRINVEAAASRAGMSSTTWQRVEDGLGVRALTYRGVENVLGLRPFIIDELLNGTADWSELDHDSGAERTIKAGGLTGEQARALEEFLSTLGREGNSA